MGKFPEIYRSQQAQRDKISDATGDLLSVDGNRLFTVPNQVKSLIIQITDIPIFYTQKVLSILISLNFISSFV